MGNQTNHRSTDWDIKSAWKNGIKLIDDYLTDWRSLNWRSKLIWLAVEKPDLRGYSCSFRLVPFESMDTVSYSPSIAFLALSCIISQTKRDTDWKSWCFSYPLHSTLLLCGSPSEYCHPVRYWKIRMVWLTDGEKKFDDMFSHVLACDRRTDILSWHSPLYAYASPVIKLNPFKNFY